MSPAPYVATASEHWHAINAVVTGMTGNAATEISYSELSVRSI